MDVLKIQLTPTVIQYDLLCVLVQGDVGEDGGVGRPGIPGLPGQKGPNGNEVKDNTQFLDFMDIDLHNIMLGKLL